MRVAQIERGVAMSIGRRKSRYWSRAVALLALLLASDGAVLSTRLTFEEKIQKFDCDITILENSNIRVRETIELSNGGGEFAHGFDRRFLLKRRDQLGHSWTVTYGQIEVVRDGKPETWKTIKEDDEMVLRIGDSKEPIPIGEHTYVVTYVSTNQIRQYDAIEEFRRNVTGTWTVPIEHLAVNLHFPSSVPNGRTEVTGYTSATPAQLLCDCKHEVNSDGVHSFITIRTLLPSEQLTIEARFPTGFLRRTTLEDVRFWVQNHANLYAFAIFVASIVVYYLIAFGILKAVNSKAPKVFRSIRHTAAIAGAIIAVLSIISLFVTKQPYGAMPGFLVGVLAMMILTGGVHGPDDPLSLWMVLALGANFGFYYLLSLGLCRFFSFGKAQPQDQTLK
jgi:hypothetical protein